MSVQQYSYVGTRLWMRVFDRRIVTEEGIYADGQLPESYAGSEIELEFNQIMVFGTSAGTFTELSVMDFVGVMDSEGKTGVGFTYPMFGIDIAKAAKGPSAHVMTGEVAFYDEENNFTEAEHAKLTEQYRRYLTDIGYVLP